MRAFVFPGQGGMVGDTAEELLPQIRKVVGERIPTQVRTFAKAVQDAHEIQKLNLRPDIVAGHSLGEYGAAYAAGCFDLETGLRLVAARDTFMAEAAQKTPGGMVAILRTPSYDIERTLQEMNGTVVAANYNSPYQTVISGLVDALGEAVSRIKGKAVRLNVSLAAHSPYMTAASEKMREVLETVEFYKPQVPVISAMDGSILESAEAVKDALKEQMVAPVKWVKVVETMARIRVEEWVELGGGNVLTRMLRDFEVSLKGIPFEELRTRVSQQAQNLLPRGPNPPQ